MGPSREDPRQNLFSELNDCVLAECYAALAIAWVEVTFL